MAEDFSFVLGREGARTFLRLRGRGMRQLPDFRRYTGLKRELLREFIALKDVPTQKKEGADIRPGHPPAKFSKNRSA
jgi:hypothetical protein